MIIRQWRADALPSDEAEYVRHFHDEVIPYLQAVPGFLEVSLARREMGGRIELLVMTKWESLEAVRTFAGSDASRAVVKDGAKAALAFHDEHADLYEIVASDVVRGAALERR